jgi:hypothetical protein
MEPIFLEQSHGFRRGRGARTFFLSVGNWPEMEYLIRCDIRKCFESLVHDKLLGMLLEHLGQDNLPFFNINRALSESKYL